jgi:hypothetical protein
MSEGDKVKRKTYKYVIELDRPVWPRKIADSAMWPYGMVYNAKLLSVKGLQYNTHMMSSSNESMKKAFRKTRRNYF